MSGKQNQSKYRTGNLSFFGSNLCAACPASNAGWYFHFLSTEANFLQLGPKVNYVSLAHMQAKQKEQKVCGDNPDLYMCGQRQQQPM